MTNSLAARDHPDVNTFAQLTQRIFKSLVLHRHVLVVYWVPSVVIVQGVLVPQTNGRQGMSDGVRGI